MKILLPNFCRTAVFLLSTLFFAGYALPATAQTTAVERGVPFAVYLEAECGAVGENWRTVEDTLASGGTYVVIKNGFTSLEVPPEDVPANRVSFSVVLQEADAIYLSARVQSLTPASDSYWIRVNGGEWVKWFSGLRLRTDWVWRSVVNSPFDLPAGEATFEFAFREPDTRLDKIYVSSMRASPVNFGGPSINCDDTTQCAANPELCENEFWAEAECADIGSRWTYAVNTLVSNSGFLTFSPPTVLTAPDGSQPDNYLTFTPTLAAGGNYNLFFRLNAVDAGKNSFYVQIDAGNWTEFSTDTGGNPLATEGFEWRQFNSDGNKVAIDLAAGMHTIRIAGREAGTQFDKLYLGMSTAAPTGFGKVQLNCKPSDITPTREARLPSVEMSVFPNPVGDRLTVSLPELSAGLVWIDVLDATGRSVRRFNFTNGGTSFSQFIPVSDLPAGLYHLRVRTDEGRASRSFVKR